METFINRIGGVLVIVALIAGIFHLGREYQTKLDRIGIERLELLQPVTPEEYKRLTDLRDTEIKKLAERLLH